MHPNTNYCCLNSRAGRAPRGLVSAPAAGRTLALCAPEPAAATNARDVSARARRPPRLSALESRVRHCTARRAVSRLQADRLVADSGARYEYMSLFGLVPRRASVSLQSSYKHCTSTRKLISVSVLGNNKVLVPELSRALFLPQPYVSPSSVHSAMASALSSHQQQLSHSHSVPLLYLYAIVLREYAICLSLYEIIILVHLIQYPDFLRHMQSNGVAGRFEPGSRSAPKRRRARQPDRQEIQRQSNERSPTARSSGTFGTTALLLAVLLAGCSKRTLTRMRLRFRSRPPSRQSVLNCNKRTIQFMSYTRT